ncbi:MAG: ATP-binding protein [Clostridiales bacterium]|nr:ATP-binding protein [Clostridiales bacterium]
MGVYLNPGNAGFRRIINGKYVDKTGLIEYVNSTIDTTKNLTCFSRPRRFGKSFAAKMLCAYYDKTCDSRNLFENLRIGKSESFEVYLNKFDVIYMDMTGFLSRAKEKCHVLSDMQNCVIGELKEAYPFLTDEEYLPDALARISHRTGNRFIILIDEWDALFREVKEDVNLQKDYIQFLRGMFKNGSTTDLTIAAAYMTGILPIKKYGTQSALTDFKEYTMLRPLKLAGYVGFTEEEVRTLCSEYHMNFEDVKKWYDGYSFKGIGSVYSPDSVMNAMENQELADYWSESENYESLKNYISMNKDGLRDSIIAMLGGARCKVLTRRFQNDMMNLNSRDDVLTLLVHLGYLAFDSSEEEVYIPNYELAEEFRNAIEGDDWSEIETALAESEALLEATLKGNTSLVENALRKIHASTSSILQYNDENSLSCALTIAYYTAKKEYTIIRELPSGEGYADLAFLPRTGSEKPAMIIELKYNKTADGALAQIREKRYNGVLSHYKGNILLVGINYDKQTKKHECEIEQI